MKTRAVLVPNLDFETRKNNNKNTTRAKQKSNKIYYKDTKKLNKVVTRKRTQNWC
jgi:hypothetical protein